MLGLSADQVRRLEQLRDNFQRQSIRTDADSRIIELDIAASLDNDPMDLSKVEQKIREVEKLRADLRIARIRIVEQAKALLNAEQKKKLEELERRARRAFRAAARIHRLRNENDLAGGFTRFELAMRFGSMSLKANSLSILSFSLPAAVQLKRSPARLSNSARSNA